MKTIKTVIKTIASSLLLLAIGVGSALADTHSANVEVTFHNKMGSTLRIYFKPTSSTTAYAEVINRKDDHLLLHSWQTGKLSILAHWNDDSANKGLPLLAFNFYYGKDKTFIGVFKLRKMKEIDYEKHIGPVETTLYHWVLSSTNPAMISSNSPEKTQSFDSANTTTPKTPITVIVTPVKKN